MNKFELFSMIFYVLDAEWDESKNPTLGEFLSSANPFLFDSLSSAVPEIYDNFVSYITEPVTVENSYDKALNYVNSLHNGVITKAFKSIGKEEWIESTLDYLAHDHKGNIR